jgi:EpsI family protein
LPTRTPPRLVPCLLMGLGCLLLLKVGRQEGVALRAPLESLPPVLLGLPGTDQEISQEEQLVAGMSTYLLRVFGQDSGPQFSVYVGYYPSQTQGRTIHSPKNCLPGSGWEPLAAREEHLTAGGAQVTVNRYELANGNRRALVYYWYQGRGRVAANEYRVKLDLLRDAAIRGRTEEALVRVVVPLSSAVTDSVAEAMARGISSEVIPALSQLLPT